jgi:hypothetical protein
VSPAAKGYYHHARGWGRPRKSDPREGPRSVPDVVDTSGAGPSQVGVERPSQVGVERPPRVGGLPTNVVGHGHVEHLGTYHA